MALAAPAAYADVVYNDLDNTIDATHELMTVPVGSDGSTTLAIQIQGHPAGDHPGCNIQGDGHWIVIDGASDDTGVATVSLTNTGPDNLASDPGTFNTCDDTVLATVHGVAEGSATISFAIDTEKTANDPSLTFDLSQATFDVNVTAGGTPTVCDVDPAAPAWAAAILQKSGVRSGSKDYTNAVSMIANGMGTGATYGGYAKNAHPDYENAVRDALAAYFPTKTIVSAQAAARPGWVCTTQ